jgi:hypothetical protein
MFVLPPRKVLVALLALVWGGVLAQSDPGSTPAGRQAQIAKDSALGRVVAKVYDGRDSYVRIETREPGAPLNQHPVSIEAPALRELLMRLQLPRESNEALFTTGQLDEIVPPLAQALARATPEQDVSFAVSARHGLGGLALRAVTTARVFYAENRMNLIFGLVRADWETQYRGTGYLIAFEPGKRSSMVDRTVQVAATGGAVSKRPDWLLIDPLAPPVVAEPVRPPTPKPAVVITAPSPAPIREPAPPPAAPAAVPQAATPAPAVPAAAPAPAAPTPAAPTPTAEATAPKPPVAVPVPAPQPAAPATPAPTDADTLYRQTSERLKALQKLRDSGVITEEEYQQKRREILKGL